MAAGNRGFLRFWALPTGQPATFLHVGALGEVWVTSRCDDVEGLRIQKGLSSWRRRKRGAPRSAGLSWLCPAARR
jgi:hypothetical protein